MVITCHTGPGFSQTVLIGVVLAALLQLYIGICCIWFLYFAAYKTLAVN